MLIADLLQTWKFHQAFSTFEQFPNPSKISKYYPSESFLLTCGDQLCLKVVFKTWKSITDVTLSKVAANEPSTAQLSQETHGWDENNIRMNCHDQKHLPVESWVPSSLEDIYPWARHMPLVPAGSSVSSVSIAH